MTIKLLEKGYLFHTSSYMYRFLAEATPEFIKLSPVGDYPMMLWQSLHGDCYYLGEEMSRYRVFSNNSWSSQISKNRDRILQRYEKGIEALRSFNEYTEGLFNKQISKNIKSKEVDIFIIKKEYGKVLRELKYINEPRKKVKYFMLGIFDLFFPGKIKNIIEKREKKS